MQELIFRKSNPFCNLCCTKVLPSTHRSKEISVYFCTSVPELTFCHHIQTWHEHMFICPLRFHVFCSKAWKIFWTLKFNIIVWCDRCENRSGWNWLMLSSQHSGMIETGITAVVKNQPVLTFDWCALCVHVCMCLSGYGHHIVHEQYLCKCMCLYYLSQCLVCGKAIV